MVLRWQYLIEEVTPTCWQIQPLLRLVIKFINIILLRVCPAHISISNTVVTSEVDSLLLFHSLHT